jgi:segregation and condensation protein B
MDHTEIMGVLENILFAAGDSVSIDDIAACLIIDRAEFDQLITEEIEKRKKGTGLLIKRFADRIQLATRGEYGEMLFSLLGEKSSEDLTRAMLETLSIVAYKQPVTRAEIDELRGVNSSYILNALLNKGFIKEAGRKDVIGKPILYATTEEFLKHFGIESLQELPALLEEQSLI